MTWTLVSTVETPSPASRTLWAQSTQSSPNAAPDDRDDHHRLRRDRPVPADLDHDQGRELDDRDPTQQERRGGAVASAKMTNRPAEPNRMAATMVPRVGRASGTGRSPLWAEQLIP